MNVQSKKKKKEKKIKPVKLLSTRTNSRRLPLTAAVKNAMPRGFDTRLLALTDDGARRKHTHFQVKWFENNYSELMDEVKRRLDLAFAPSMDAEFATKAYLHQWLVSKLVATMSREQDEEGAGVEAVKVVVQEDCSASGKQRRWKGR